MQTDIDQRQIGVREREWKRSQRLAQQNQSQGATNPPNLKRSRRRKVICRRQRRITERTLIISALK